MNKSEIKKIVLAYSGGLDTSVIIPWLKENYNDPEIIAVAGNVGQVGELDGLEEKALKTGASKFYSLDLADEMINDVVIPSMQAGAIYEDYLLGTAFARPIIAKGLVEVALKEGADAIAHGCTGKGNDQVRFELAIKHFAPEMKVIAPGREWDLLTREQEMEWAAEHGVPVPTTAAKPYSIDDNLWGRAIECGVLEDPMNEPPADIWTMTVDPTEAPDEPEYFTVGFEAGKPVSFNGEKMPLLDLIIKVNEICGKHGYGRIDLIEDRVVGIKSHEVYECPGSLALIKMHHDLETMCFDRNTIIYKHDVDQKWSTLVYDGMWFSQLKEALDAFCESTQKFVTGEVRAKLYKGNLMVVGRTSPYAIYDYNLATYGEEDTFDRSASAGFIKLYSLELQTWSRKQGSGSKLS